MAAHDALTTALKEARLAEAARLDALLNVHDARALRLEALCDSLLPEISGSPHVRDMFEINLQDGETPRLWIDLISHVVMEPNPKTYRLLQTRDAGRVTLFETTDAEQMKNYVLRYLAHRMVAAERVIAAESATYAHGEARRYTLGEVVYIWITGAVFGVLGLIAVALATGLLSL